MLSTTDTADLCGVEYFYWPITQYRKLIFRLLSNITGGDVLDLGCGQAGLYWALSYASKANSISFFDYHQENLIELNKQMSLLSPQYLKETFADTLQFLWDSKILPSNLSSSNIATAVLEKTSQIEQFDFRVLAARKTFDFIFCIESLECVSSLHELNSVLSVCRSLLNSQGRLLGVCVRYDECTETVKRLAEIRFGGILNPNERQLRQAFEQAGFIINEISTVPTPEHYNYGQAIFFDVVKV